MKYQFPIHSVATYEEVNWVSFGQTPIDDKSNELALISSLLCQLDLRNGIDNRRRYDYKR